LAGFFTVDLVTRWQRFMIFSMKILISMKILMISDFLYENLDFLYEKYEYFPL